ncbi:MAG: hypothetical protein HY426_03830, partial [Candidatus Levybacteria bacterium]|nr:hypothetical protein [Candidatus Levybacteria bacterium]
MKATLKKVFLGLFSLFITLSLVPQPVFASLNKYFDYGPYYQTPQVLGFSLSIQENLPPFQLPSNLQIPQSSGILPDSPFYIFEKAAEATQLAFTFDPAQKEQLRLNLAAERLSEAKTMMDQGKATTALKTLDDYGKTFESLAENVADLSRRGNPQAQSLMEKLEETASAQVVTVTALSLTSSPAQAEVWTEAANTGRQALDKIAEARGEPAIPPDLSEGIQTLKEQGLISEEESNKLYGLKTRSEVRDEFNKLTSSGIIPPSEITKLDDEIAERYPEVQKQQLTNLQVVELRSYQALPQPSTEVVENLQKWQEDPTVPPSNDIKPFLWYNRAQDLAKEVDLSNFSQTQQTEVAKLYPTAIAENPTYSPPPASTRVERGEPNPSPSP